MDQGAILPQFSTALPLLRLLVPAAVIFGHAATPASDRLPLATNPYCANRSSVTTSVFVPSRRHH
jgi:hypothetical protein